MAGSTGQSYHQLGTTVTPLSHLQHSLWIGRLPITWQARHRFGVSESASPSSVARMRAVLFSICLTTGSFQSLRYQPISVYERLFGLTSSDAVTLKSVLDAVSQQVERLNRRIGVQDRQRLEQHLESIRALEQQLTFENTCDGGALPGSYADINGQEQIAARNQIMSQLMATALACDLTRVFCDVQHLRLGVIFSQECSRRAAQHLSH